MISGTNAAQNTALGDLISEGGELTADLGRAVIWGLDSYNPKTATWTRDGLALEAGQVLACIEMAIRTGAIDRLSVQDAYDNRILKFDRAGFTVHDETAPQRPA